MDIFHAIRHGNSKTVKKCLRKNPKLINKTRNGETPLHVASETGNLDVLDILFTHQPDVDTVDANGWTPLFLTCNLGHYNVALYFLDHGADPNHRCNLGDTPLHAASRSGNVELVKYLLNFDIDMDAQNFGGWTPLHRAVSSNKMDVVGVLLIHGVNPLLKTNTGKTAYDLSLSLLNIELADLIKSFEYQRQNKGVLDTPSTLVEENALKRIVFEKKKELSKLFSKRPPRLLPETRNFKTPEFLQKSFEHWKDMLNHKKEKSSINVKTKIQVQHTPQSEEIDDADEISDDENECPVCFEVPLPPVHIYQCINGHIYCGNCKEQPNMIKCPQCGVNITGVSNRNRYAEETIAKAYNNKKTEK